MRKLILTAAACLAFAGAAISQAQAGVTYVASDWNRQDVVLLDENMLEVSSFSAAESNPNGVTGTDSLLFSGHFSTQEVVAYDYSGVEQFRWGDSRLSGLQGMAIVGSELAIFANGSILAFDPMTGVFGRTITTGLNGTVEGLAFDGSSLWALDSNAILEIDPTTGATLSTIANAASGESFGGTGIANSGAGALMLAGASGNWFRVSTADGSVLSTGNNSINMFGLSDFNGANAVPLPTPAALGLLGMGLVMAVRRRRRRK